jgi:outer membrane protein assembly factor BamB
MRVRVFPGLSRTISLVGLLSALSVLTAMAAPAEDWPQWRGPNRDGAATALREPKAWPERLQQVWKMDVGIGYANPLVIGARVYLHTRQGGNEVVACFDLETGKQIWKQSYPAPYKMNSAAAGHGEGPKSTPVAAGGRLFTFGISGVLTGWDLATGKQLWGHDFTKEYSETWPDFGVAMSPLVDGNLVIAHAGGNKEGMLAAFDTATGAVKWSWKGDGPAYASPIVVDLGGARQVVTQSRDNIVGVAVSNGQLLWKIPFTTAYTQNIITPVLYKDMLILSGLDKGVFAIRVKKTGTTFSTDKVWENADLPMYMSSPVIAGDYLYGMTHKKKGAYFCLDARTGATQWVTNGRDGDNAALLTTASSLLILNQAGELLVVKQNPKAFEMVRKYQVADSATWAEPSVAGQRLLIKDVNTLALWRIE